ncbi:MAG: RNA polymerase sigma factor [Steroidobacteraceae bacterium]
MAGAGNRYLLEALECEGLLRTFLFRYAHNAADVDELLQETYAHLLTAQAESNAEIRSVRAFALTVARNVALDWLRHRNVVPISLVADIAALEVLDESAQVEEIVNAHQELALLAECVAELPERCRQALTLRRVYGLSQREIAERLRIKEGTVEQLLARAVRRCAEALFAREVGAHQPHSLADRLARRLKRHE